MFIVYLLHYDREETSVAHYIGSTRTDQMQRRQRAHRKAYGTTTTTGLASQYTHVQIARTWLVSSRDYEQKLIAQGAPEMLCPVCNRTLRKFLHFPPMRIKLEPPTPDGVAALEF